MPRKSQAALTVAPLPRVDGRPAPLATPAGLSDEARGVWGQIVASVPPEHFRPSDAPLLRSFCESTATADLAAARLADDGYVVGDRVSPWLNVQERAFRAQAMLATRLRLCPSARTDSRAAGRERPAGFPSVDFSKLDDEQ
jgi:phage terminase small subunit